jgi:hypothetical protein
MPFRKTTTYPWSVSLKIILTSFRRSAVVAVVSAVAVGRQERFRADVTILVLLL